MIPVHASVGGTSVAGTQLNAAYANLVILILRLYALFGGNKPLLYLLIVLLSGQVISEIAIVQGTLVHQDCKQMYSRLAYLLTDGPMLKHYSSLAALPIISY